jgi:ParB family chromosome partitioning protein
MGLSKRSYFRLNRIAQRLHSDLRAAVRGTPVADNQAALLKLAKMEPQEQRRAAIALRAEGGDLKKALGHVKAVRPAEKPEAKRDGMLKALLDIWHHADDETRKAFLAEIGREDAA